MAWASSSSRWRRPRPQPPDLPDRYILHVGVQRPHKNHAILVEALAMLKLATQAWGSSWSASPTRDFPITSDGS